MEREIKIDPRCTFTLENILRMQFHPIGARRFMKGMNKALDLGPIQSAFNLGLGTALDIIKYIIYAAPFVYKIASAYSNQ